MPKVTVLMPVYNAGLFLREAINSILGQTWPDFEFLIINDGSTDNSREIISSFSDPRIRLIDNPTNIGLTKSLNRGLQLSKGEYIARQDADDISYPERLEKQILFLDAHPDIVLLGTRGRAIDKNGNPSQANPLRIPVGLLAIHWYLMFQNAFIHSSVMFRRVIVWERLGGYDESFKRAQDYEIWSRTARSFKVENLSDIFIDHRFEYGSIVSRLPLTLAPEEDIAHKNLQVFLKYPDVPVQWSRFINSFRRKEKFDDDTDWRQVSDLFDRISTRYCELNPAARQDQSIRSHMADNFYWIAYYSAPYNRSVSLSAYMRARKLATKTDRHPPLIKYAMLWSTGDWIRRLYHRCRHNLNSGDS
ncbi:glycosyltransferase family 2 protein [Thermodesulfobacteriota bacterium]